MDAECISIGDELLLGQTINTNAAYIGERLAEVGVNLRHISTVGDSADDIEQALKRAWERSQVVLVTGGLGPTHDDITKQVIVEFFDTELVENAEVLAQVKAAFDRRGIPMPELNREQAMVPVGCELIINQVGTAPGMVFERDDRLCVVMPGVPREMRSMVDEYVLPRLKDRSGSKVIRYRMLKTTGIAESALYEKLDNLELIQKSAKVAFLPKHTGVTIRLTVEADTAEAADSQLDEAQELVLDRVGKWVYDDQGQALEQVLWKELLDRELTISVSESCTGGLICHRLTNLTKSSYYFIFGCITYSNRSKVEVLGVDEALIEEHGAVSEPVARQMATSVAKLAGTDIGVATTGIAGPTGSTPEKPVGLVYVSVWYRGDAVVERHVFKGDRLTNKDRFAQAALDLVRRTITEK